MIINIITFNYDENFFKQASDIRYQVFVDELKYNKFNEFDSYDFTALHFLVLMNQKPVASARARELEHEFVIEKLAVLKQFRSKSIGSMLLRYVINDILNSKKNIVIEIENNLKSFFEFHGFATKITKEVENKKIIKMYYNQQK